MNNFIDKILLEARSYEAPSRLFELSQNWNLPDGYDYVKLNSTIGKIYKKNKYKEIIDKLYFALLDLNPELKNIHIQNTKSDLCNKSDIIWGVASRLNYSDIKFYVEIWWNKKDIRYTNYLKIFDKFEEEHPNIDLGWYPSPETLSKIIQQIT
jgi:hypothetical protein